MTDEKQRAWVYLRVGASGDANYCLKKQSEVLSDYAKWQGYEVVGIAQDIGSGPSFKQNGLAKVAEAAAAGEMKALFIASLGRDEVPTINFLRGLNEQGIKIFSAKEGEINAALFKILSPQVVDALMNLANPRVMEHPYLVAYSEDDIYVPHVLKVTPKNIAAFIAQSTTGAGGDVLITTPSDVAVISTHDGVIDYCSDQDFLENELLPMLTSMQQGDMEIPAVEEMAEGGVLDSRQEADPERAETDAQTLEDNPSMTLKMEY
ncbi:recombinase family protein [Desulfosporosinus youngiae]|uniref:Site-specific recombinase, DNA invertase Pin n=1 Tax=Desulfosporosinus youngiae DSM 17734 TaxID=768710 RepID=H5Y2J7_9FIRM|nr:recombinase family protein [Desulfosporosinus youngiae]EHQ88688.1 site-specific recombinase, DNA invertase Pin [Desulfosporosinus youngiae DSM 17734]